MPAGFTPDGYVKQDPATGALQRFDFDGTTGAVVNGDVVTLHFVDGGRGDADGVANGVIVDPGGPVPYVRLKALDPTAAKYRVDAVHGTSTGAFAVFRGGDLSDPLTVHYTVDSSSTAVAGQDYTALTGSVTIASGQASAGILIRPLDNAAANSTKTVAITLSESVDYVVGTTGSPVVSIAETNTVYPWPIQVSGDRPTLNVLTLDANAGELPGESSTGLMLVNRTALVTEMFPMGGTTWTNPAAVTAYYTASQTGTASGDYESLSGSVSLPYAVYAAEIKITPVDDAYLEGPETVTIALTPNATYYVTSPGGTGAVTIQDNEEPPVAPQANPDEYAMDANDSTLSVAASGVLYNDYAFSPGAMTAVLEAGPSGGTVVLNSNGSFVYTPGDDIKATGGNDSFQYVAVQNGMESVTTAVTIHVVRVTLTPDSSFVPINADNDNDSPVTNEIPQTRDFNTTLGWQCQQPYIDNDLVKVRVTVNPDVGLPGFFTISVANNGTGQIRLWKRDDKVGGRAEGAYTQAGLANLNNTFYMEGFEPSVRDGNGLVVKSVVTVQYLFVGQNGLPLAAGQDQFAATVTPVINNFTITGNGVKFMNGMNGLNGMETGAGAAPGASFLATVTRTDVTGNVVYIQNLQGVENGGIGVPAGAVYTAASGRPNKNLSLTVVGATFPLLDIPQLGVPLDPKYPSQRPVDNPDIQRITATDSPQIFPPNPADLTDINVVERFRLYLVWRFDTEIIYTLASFDWYVVFRADTFVAGQGVTRVLYPIGVLTESTFAINHDNPVVTAPIPNGSVTWV